MGAWQRGDLLSVAAILSGAVLGARLPPPVLHREAPSPAPASPAAPLPSFSGVAFHASSLGDYEEIEGDHGGRVTYEEGQVVVTLPVSKVVAPYGAFEGTRLVSLSLALVDPMRSGSDGVVQAGPPVVVDLPLEQPAGVWLRDVRLTLPAPDEAALRDHTLAVVHEVRVPGMNGWRTEWTRARADDGLLNRLLGWYGEGCC